MVSALEQNFGGRYLCQNLGPDRHDSSDPRNGCRLTFDTNFQDCCNGEGLYGTRAQMKAPPWGWADPPDWHVAAMRVAAEGGYQMSGNFLRRSLLQGGIIRVDRGLTYDIDCYTPHVKRKYSEWGRADPETDNEMIFHCEFGAQVQENETVVVSVQNRETGNGDDWSSFVQGENRFDFDDMMLRASSIYVGGEFATDRACLVFCPGVQTRCIGAGYGIGGGTPWQRARRAGFGDPFTIQSAYSQNNKNKWKMDGLANGFWIRNRACPPI